MRFASAVLLVVGALCLAAESAAGPFLFFDYSASAERSYAVDTPEPEGRTFCLCDIVVNKLAGDPGELIVELETSGGEARIPEWGLGSGFQPGCDIFPDGPHSTQISLPISDSVSVFHVYLQVHAHPLGPIPDNCTQSGHAAGLVFAWAGAKTGPPSVSMSPIVCRAQ